MFIASLEARRRSLRLILFAKGLPGVGTTTVNELRRNCEMWTDDLLAELQDLPIAEQYCFDRLRLRRTHESRSQHGGVSTRRRDARLMAMRYSLDFTHWRSGLFLVELPPT